MNPILKYGDNYIEFTDLCYFPEEAKRYNPYNCTAVLTVRSNGFAGVSPCDFDMRELIRFTDELRKMYDFKLNSTGIQEIGYGGTLDFSLDHTGHIRISGDVFGYAMQHELKFEFEADQTSLAPFIAGLRQFTER